LSNKLIGHAGFCIIGSYPGLRLVNLGLVPDNSLRNNRSHDLFLTHTENNIYKMDDLSTSNKISRTESGLGRMPGSRTNEGLKGSDVGTRSQDEDDDYTAATTSYQELRRRKFFDHIGRSRRPALYRRNASSRLPGALVTTVVETIVDIASDRKDGKTDQPDSTIGAYPIPEHPTGPAVPEFPTLSNPIVPTVPAYPFNLHFSQSIISSPPPSPLPSDTSLTPIASFAAPSSPLESSSYNKCSGSSAIATSTTTAPTVQASYFNSTSTTSTFSKQATSTSLISSSYLTTFSTRTSSSFPESTSRSTAAGAVATTSATDTAPAFVATSGSSADPPISSGGSASPNTPQVIGGVVGGIAGLAIILLIALFFLRRYRQQLRDRGALLEPDGLGGDAPNTMSMRSSHTPLVAAVTASFKKMRPGSSQTTATGETGLSDRGFQRVAGRKIEPVLTSGGDGYGGNYGAFGKETEADKETGAPSSSHPEAQPLAGTSFYCDDNDFYGGHGSRTSTPKSVSARCASGGRDFAGDSKDEYHRGPSPDAIVVMRPSPARSPVATSAGPSHLAPKRPGPTLPNDAPPTPALPTRFAPDGVGRSLASQDGSRGSRFTESV
jgi:hypothetical protein